jgi:hypothetical protein
VKAEDDTAGQCHHDPAWRNLQQKGEKGGDEGTQRHKHRGKKESQTGEIRGACLETEKRTKEEGEVSTHGKREKESSRLHRPNRPPTK